MRREVTRLRGAPFVAVVQTADLWNGNHGSSRPWSCYFEPVMSENLAETLRRTTVVIEKAAKSLAAPNAAGPTSRRDSVDQFIGKALVISFAVIVGHVFVKGPAEVPIPTESSGRDIRP